MAAELGLPYYETSAATGDGVDEAIDGLLTLVMARIERSLEEERRKMMNQENQNRRRSFRLPQSLSDSMRIRNYNTSTVDLYQDTNNSYCSC